MTPMQPSFQTQPAGPQTELSSPAIGLIAAGGLGAFLTLIGVVGNLFTLVKGSSAGFGGVGGFDDPNLPPIVRTLFKTASSGVFGLFLNLIQAGVNGFIIYAGIQMREARQYAVCVAGAALASVPLCFSSCCCIFTVPLGIWALSVLLGQNGKAHFQPT